jgi:hypothetical protein
MFAPNLCRGGVADCPPQLVRCQLGLQIQAFAIGTPSVCKSVVAASTRAFDRGKIKAVAGPGANMLNMKHKTRRYERRVLLGERSIMQCLLNYT